MNRCVVENCLRERVADALVCRVHLGDLWGNRLARTATGYVAEPEWMRRRRTNGLPAKDLTRAA